MIFLCICTKERSISEFVFQRYGRAFPENNSDGDNANYRSKTSYPRCRHRFAGFDNLIQKVAASVQNGAHLTVGSDADMVYFVTAEK